MPFTLDDLISSFLLHPPRSFHCFGLNIPRFAIRCLLVVEDSRGGAKIHVIFAYYSGKRRRYALGRTLAIRCVMQKMGDTESYDSKPCHDRQYSQHFYWQLNS